MTSKEKAKKKTDVAKTLWPRRGVVERNGLIRIQLRQSLLCRITFRTGAMLGAAVRLFSWLERERKTELVVALYPCFDDRARYFRSVEGSSFVCCSLRFGLGHPKGLFVYASRGKRNAV